MSVPPQPDLAPDAKRVVAIDVFRGLTMLVMIFANDLDMAGIKNVPNWMKHVTLAVPPIPRHLINQITFVDMIAGAFLFIVGASIPLAIRNRRQKGDSSWQIARHVMMRTAGLLIMGVYMGNMRTQNVDPIGISHATWSVLMLLGLTLVWNNYPKATDWQRNLFIALRLAGIALLVALAIVYRKYRGQELVGMNYTNWFVLGMIGWSYLVACGVLALFKRHIAGVAACGGLMLLFWIVNHESGFHQFPLLNQINRYVALGSTIGAGAAITAAGLIVGMLFVDHSPAQTPGRRIQWIAVMGLFAFLAGALLRPVYGLSKAAHTPTCTLYNIAICCALFIAMYWILDVRGWRRWANFTLPAARNALLPYILHYLIHPLSVAIGLAWLNEYLNDGAVGIVRTLGVTALIGVVLTSLLTRAGIRIRL